MDNEQVKSHKTGTIVTYVIVLVALLAGFFIPLSFSFEGATDTMLAWQLPEILAAALGIESLQGVGSAMTISYSVNLFGIETAIDLGAWLALLYALFTVVGLFFLIPVLAGKRTKRTSLNSAFVIELLAMTSLVLLCLLDMTNFVSGATDKLAYILLIALAVVVIMAFVQRTMADGGSGVIKFILVILSAAAVLCVIFPVETIIPALAGNLSVGEMGSGVIGEAVVGGLVTELMTGTLALSEGAAGILDVFLIILGMILILNLVLDIWGLCKKPNMFMHVVNQIRFLIALVAEIVIIIMAYTVECDGMGLMLIVATCITVVEYVIDLIRIIMHCHKKNKAEAPDVVEYQYYVETVDKAEAKRERKEREKAAKQAQAEQEAQAKKDAEAKKEQELKDEQARKEAKKNEKKEKHAKHHEAEPVAAEPEPAESYASVPEEEQVVYNGPTDEFIDKLTEKEKMEFWTVFLKREDGPLSMIPEYKLGEDNSKFFSTISIYYSKVRSLISDGLMDKFYEENKLI